MNKKIIQLNSFVATISLAFLMSIVVLFGVFCVQLDSKNDPVIYTTDCGLQIKYGNALTYLTGYTYFSAGGYNWVIIGYDASMSEYVGSFTGEGLSWNKDPVQGTNTILSTLDDSPAGKAIRKEEITVLISQAAKQNDEIGDGCVLCICDTVIGGTDELVAFNSSASQGNNYSGSYLEGYINDLYTGTTDLSLALQELPIVPQTLNTKSASYPNGKDIGPYHLFPLAAVDSSESFYCSDYLTKTQCDLDCYWWLRSGYPSDSTYGQYVNSGGTIAHTYNGNNVTHPANVRPAFVLQIL